MNSIAIAEARAKLSTVLKNVQAGEEFIITSDRSKEPVAVVVPFSEWKKSQSRKLGSLSGKVRVEFSDDLQMTEEELFCES